MGCCFGNTAKQRTAPPRPQAARRSIDSDGGWSVERRSSGGSLPGRRRSCTSVVRQKTQMSAKTGVLNVSEMGLTEPPESELVNAGVKRVRVADLSKNHIVTVGSSFIRMCAGLKQLHLQGNNLCDMEAIRDVPTLEYLDLSSNHLTMLTSLKGLRGLKEFRATDNALVHLEADIFDDTPKLRLCSLARNQLSALPPSLFRLAKLEEFSAAHNTLTSFGSGDAAGSLKELRMLDVTANRLRALPETLFADTKLTQLRIEHNPLKLDSLKEMESYQTWQRRQKGIVDRQIAGGLEAKLN
eukprot:TRINITY_DN2494_c3_g1_i1.p1 TRINITY_DN2494_c3_g1~~TRINITY_DN2494_c3_g1_i1.p1  ORF type:complete len:341 (+),score=96.06 TRINITY_DN2494_c3_g1_i1:131-1024(+)